MNTVFWIIIAGIVLALAVGVASIYAASRRKKLEEQPRPELEPEVPLAEPESDYPPLAEKAPVEVPPAPDAGQLTPEPSDTVETVEPTAEEPATLDEPEAPATRMVRLRRRLASSENALARALANLLSSDQIDGDTWDDFETTLITSDLGVGPATELVESLRNELRVEGISDPAQAKDTLRRHLVDLVDPSLDRSLNLEKVDGKPAVILVVGVNGTGKTTTVGKLGRMLVADGKTLVFGAADTFRAAAAEQLTTWGERVGVETIRAEEGADPASVAFETVKHGIETNADVVLIDTAGRLHTKVGLMDELGKVKRVVEKQAPVSEVLLVIDATTGQNGLTQARIFSEVVDVTGLVLSKLDGSAKGGIVVQVQRELGVPVKFIGLGEGVDDLAVFDSEQFVAGLLGE